LAAELPLLLDWARAGKLNLTQVITRTVPLEAQAINDTLDHLEAFGSDARVVVTP
jgi:Zn-dependent alcohol dehydrogenase